MDRILGYLAMVYIFLPWRPIVVLVAAILFVNINGTELYGWQAGLAHGLFFLPNLVRHLFDGDVLFKATNCTTGYHVAWWIATVGSCIGWLVDACFSFMKAYSFFWEAIRQEMIDILKDMTKSYETGECLNGEE